jgi:hypothetical protein
MLVLSGCPGSRKEPVLDDIKIGDLASSGNGRRLQPTPLNTIDFEIHIFEMPAENIDKLEKIQNQLFIRPLRLTNYPAFTGNAFSVRFGRFDMWNEILEKLLAADSHKLANVSLMLPDGMEETISITGLKGPRTILFVGDSGKTEGANVISGIFGLRIKADRIRELPGVCDIVVNPVFSPQIRSGIPDLDERGKLRDFLFTPAAFGSRMSPGDFILFSPTEYLDDQKSLGSLVFSNPQGSMFISNSGKKPPEVKPAVRVFLFMCTRISE